MHNLLTDFDDIVIYIDRNFKITSINNITEKLLNKNQNNILNINLSDLILNFDLIKNELLKLINGESKNFSSRINIIDNDRNKKTIDAKFSIIMDKFNDIVGILIIGNEVKASADFIIFVRELRRIIWVGREIGKANNDRVIFLAE